MLPPLSYSNFDLVFLLFSITDRSTYEGLESWLRLCTSKMHKAQVVLVGTKTDGRYRRVTDAEAYIWAEARGCSYFESTCTTPHLVREIVHESVCKVLLRRNIIVKAAASSPLPDLSQIVSCCSVM